jgi:phosphate starvation-inducible PhoH-like protein
MGEKIIDLGGINPLDIYGTNNKTLTFILDFFPKVKCVARGNTLKLIGDDESIEEFEKKFSLMLEHFIKYQRLTHSNIERIILEDSAVLLGDNDTLVHGPHGKIIKARTANQRKMVKESQKNDMVFAVGPAGTGKTYTAVAIAVRAL